MIQGHEEEVMVETFRSLSIDMIEVEDQKAKDTRLPPFPCGQTLNKWTSIELPVVFRFLMSNDHEQPVAACPRAFRVFAFVWVSFHEMK